MRQVVRLFGQPESDEGKALRILMEGPGGSSAIARQEYVDFDGNVIGTSPTRPAAGERFLLTEAAAAEHDRILDNLQAGFLE